MKRPFNSLLAAPALLIFSGTFALAADAPPGTQEWFRGQNSTITPPPPQSGGTDFGQQGGAVPVPPANQHAPNPGMQAGNNSTDFPGDQVHDWVVASARYAYSRAMFHRAEKELDDSVRMEQFTFEQSKEYKDAVDAEKRAYDAYIAERQHALQSVLKDPKYLAALELRDKTGDKISQLRAKHGDIPRDMLAELASLKLQFASDAHAMESEALDRDSSLKDLRQRMVEANARVSSLRTSFDLSVRTSPRILQARRNLEDARVALITSEAYLNAATIATAVASDYSYYRHRWDGLAAPQYGWAGPGPWGY
jgi:hypothetical protein